MIDLHLHTTASDGTLAPADLIARAARAGLTTVSVTDHDTLAGLEEASGAGARLGVTVVAGIEITAVEAGRDVHILGYFVDAGHAGLGSFLRRQRTDRIARVRQIGERLRELGYPIDVEPLLVGADRSTGRSPGRPLVADALIRAGHVRDREEAFERLLGIGCPAFVERCGEPPERIVATIREAGGVASLAHPGLLGMDGIIPRLASAGLGAIEVRHSEHTAAHEAHYRAMARDLGLAVSGGSDYHGDVGRRAGSLGVVTLPREDFAALQERVP